MNGQTLTSSHKYYTEDGVKMVGIPEEEYEKMKENLEDIAAYLERKDETPISLEEYKKWLKEEGLL
jgi:hypothetical protein